GRAPAAHTRIEPDEPADVAPIPECHGLPFPGDRLQVCPLGVYHPSLRGRGAGIQPEIHVALARHGCRACFGGPAFRVRKRTPELHTFGRGLVGFEYDSLDESVN